MRQEVVDHHIYGGSFDDFLAYLGEGQSRGEGASCRRDDATMPPSSSSSSSPSPSSSSSVDIGDRYRIVGDTMLGEGLGGCVRECVDVVTGVHYAVKTVPRVRDDADHAICLSREISILREMSHRNIVRLFDVREDGTSVHLVTDLCTGGSLFDRIVGGRANGDDDGSCGDGDGRSHRRRRRCFAEDDASRILGEILDAVSYMHGRGVVHRDIKAENVLFVTSDMDSSIRVIDFGLALDRRAGGGGNDVPTMLTEAVGSPYYVAPEVLRGKYDESCDIWSVGVIAYVLLCGYPPFNGSDRKGIYNSVLAGRYRFPSKDWNGISREAMDFVRRLLEVDTTKRMTAEEALVHPWIRRTDIDDGTASSKREGVNEKRCRLALLEKKANVRGFDLVRWINRKVHAQ
ncbi:hypothetical protein ACHAXA_010208 [Cyclostephanos tholiformis]|uniref:Protein kinase domain-containing protein n=1 Tax=Cyclostephanos tholiformis TaxID=382380 RepID=A0ABD3SG27_9STRA